MERVLFCPGNRMITYDWSRGSFGGVRSFSANEDGYREFETYLQDSGFRPVHILVDLIEEEFHQDVVPHVWGSDRAAVLDRALKKYFRTSELRTVQLQRRKKSGRRDHEVMISGLGNVSILRKWIDILQRLRVPVKGVYSLPLIGQGLLPSLKLDKKRVLLVSQQSTMTLRQSFYDHGYLKLSRLALHRMTRDDSISDVNYVETDVNNTLLYLRSQRLLRRNEPLEVCIIVRDELYKSFELGLPGDDLVTFTLLNQDDVSRRIGVTTDLPTTYSDGVFAHTLLSKSQLKNHYGSRSLTRFYRYHTARRALLAASGLVLLGGTAFAGSRYYEAQLLQGYSQDARQQLQQYSAHYEQRIGQAKSHRLSPDAVRASVNTIERLRDFTSVQPMPVLSKFAHVLSNHDNVTVSKIHWLLHPQDIEIGSSTAQPRSAFSDDFISGKRDFELVQIHGEVISSGNNFRGAVDIFDAFIRDIRATEDYRDVKMLKIPFDVSSETSLSGDSGTLSQQSLAAQSTFLLQLTLADSGKEVDVQ